VMRWRTPAVEETVKFIDSVTRGDYQGAGL